MVEFESSLGEILSRHGLGDAQVERVGDGTRPTFVLSIPATLTLAAFAEAVLDLSAIATVRLYGYPDSNVESRLGCLAMA